MAAFSKTCLGSRLRAMSISVALALALVVAGVVGLSGFTRAAADSGSQTKAYLLGTGSLCALPLPSPCPDVAMAPNGDTVAITGSGTISIHAKSATGGGTFTHKAPDGSVRFSGTWTAVGLLGFHSYGSGAVQGLPAEFEGGHALIRVHLVEPNIDAILEVTCTLGDQVPGGPNAEEREGVRLNVPGVINFNKEVSGVTLFIATP